jgi:hypothetical protein
MIFHVNIYYAVIIAWGLFYLAMSFSSIPGVPWTSCDNWWNSEHCYDPLLATTSPAPTNGSDGTTVALSTPWGVNATMSDDVTDTTPLTTMAAVLVDERKSSVEEYWE